MKHLLLSIAILFAAFSAANAQFAQPRGGYEPAAEPLLLACPAAAVGDLAPQPAGSELEAALAQKRTGRALLITGGALSLTGIALYCSSWTMISDSTDVGKYFSIGGIATFAAAIPFYITGSVLYVKGKKASLTATPGTVALNF